MTIGCWSGSRRLPGVTVDRGAADCAHVGSAITARSSMVGRQHYCRIRGLAVQDGELSLYCVVRFMQMADMQKMLKNATAMHPHEKTQQHLFCSASVKYDPVSLKIGRIAPEESRDKTAWNVHFTWSMCLTTYAGQSLCDHIIKHTYNTTKTVVILLLFPSLVSCALWLYIVSWFAQETEISAALWALRLGKGLYFFTYFCLATDNSTWQTVPDFITSYCHVCNLCMDIESSFGTYV